MCEKNEGLRNERHCWHGEPLTNWIQSLRNFVHECSPAEWRKLMRETSQQLRKTIASGRTNVLMVRVSDGVLEKIDFLVEQELFRSRSEAAAFLISKGLDGIEGTIEEVMEKAKQIEALRKEIREILGVKDESAEEAEDKAEEEGGGASEETSGEGEEEAKE